MSHWESAGKTDDWYTPPEVFEALGCEFDLDVAGAPKANVPARMTNIRPAGRGEMGAVEPIVLHRWVAVITYRRDHGDETRVVSFEELHELHDIIAYRIEDRP